MSLTIEKQGRRLYVVGNSYSVKSDLKSVGCKWDGDRRQWWVGSTKKSDLEAVVERVNGQGGEWREPTAEELADKKCTGKVEYKGRTYYVIGRSERKGKLWLTVLNCSINFWAIESACKWEKRYQVSEDRYGNLRYQTVGKIRGFIEDNKRSRKDVTAETKQCWECGCQFTKHDARSNGGDWSDSYCGC